MPCIVDSEKTDSNVLQKDSQLVIKDLKMDSNTKQEKGAEATKGENGHADGKESPNGIENGDDAGVGNDSKKTDEEGKEEESKENSEKTEGVIISTF